jgi:FdhD protein
VNASGPAERPLWITLNGVRRVVLSCSPHDIGDLALGYLLSEGWIDAGDGVRELRIVEGPGGCMGVAVEAGAERAAACEVERQHQTAHGCGIRHFIDCEPHALGHVGATTNVIDAVPLLRELFAWEDRETRGGVHAAALSDGISLLEPAYDVARHCAVDRVLGSALRQRHDLAQLGMVCTARISGAMALKAVRSGLRFVASRSVATALAHEIAAHHGLTLSERAGRAPRSG